MRGQMLPMSEAVREPTLPTYYQDANEQDNQVNAPALKPAGDFPARYLFTAYFRRVASIFATMRLSKLKPNRST